MNLTLDLINRLTAIRSLLALGDLELVAAASVRLESFRSEDALAAVLDALASHRYSEADQMISAILTEGLRLEMLRRKVANDPSAAGKIPQAEADFRDFTSDQDAIRKEAQRTEWKLNEDEQ